MIYHCQVVIELRLLLAGGDYFDFLPLQILDECGDLILNWTASDRIRIGVHMILTKVKNLRRSE